MAQAREQGNQRVCGSVPATCQPAGRWRLVMSLHTCRGIVVPYNEVTCVHAATMTPFLLASRALTRCPMHLRVAPCVLLMPLHVLQVRTTLANRYNELAAAAGQEQVPPQPTTDQEVAGVA